MQIKVAGSLVPGTVNTPLDGRSRVATLAELENLQNPYLGQLVYCLANGKYYVITALMSRIIGAREVKDAAVAAWQELATGDGGGSSISTLQLVKPADGVHLIIKLAGADGTLANASTLIDTAANADDRSKVRGFLASGTDGIFTDCPAEGFGLAYDGAAISVNLAGISGTIFYAWSGDDGSLSDYRGMIFPCAGGGGGDAVMTGNSTGSNSGSDSGSDSGVVPVIGDNGNWWINGNDTGKKATGTGSNVVLSVSPPAEPYDGMIWCTVENALDYTYLNVTALPVVISAAEPAAPENGTIWIMEE